MKNKSKISLIQILVPNTALAYSALLYLLLITATDSKSCFVIQFKPFFSLNLLILDTSFSIPEYWLSILIPSSLSGHPSSDPRPGLNHSHPAKITSSY